jgi:hypothetical protein
MLKKSASFVLASLRGSTYRSVRLASSLAAALLDGLFEHPADYSGTITLRIITTAYRAKTEFSRKLLEWTAHGALKPRERQGEFEARQIVIHGDLALDPLGIEDIQEAGGALAEAQLGDAKRFLRLL